MGSFTRFTIEEGAPKEVVPEELTLDSFRYIPTPDRVTVHIAGSEAPDRLTELKQRYTDYSGIGSTPVSAQIEAAWIDGDDDAVRDLIKLYPIVE